MTAAGHGTDTRRTVETALTHRCAGDGILYDRAPGSVGQL